MAYRPPHHRYASRRAANRLAKKSKRKFIITLIIISALSYTTLVWALPSFIGGLGFVKSVVKPSQITVDQTSDNITLAPPVLNIPFEATNSGQIDIKGYGASNSKVKLYMNDEEKQTIDVASDGTFDFENVTLSLGTNNIYGKTIDDKGKESLPSKTIQLIYDNEKPALKISEPEDNKKNQGGDKKVKISGKTDPNIKVYINDTQVIVDKDGNFSTEQPLNDGDNTFTIKAIDIATNTTEVQRKVTYSP